MQLASSCAIFLLLIDYAIARRHYDDEEEVHRPVAWVPIVSRNADPNVKQKTVEEILAQETSTKINRIAHMLNQSYDRELKELMEGDTAIQKIKESTNTASPNFLLYNIILNVPLIIYRFLS